MIWESPGADEEISRLIQSLLTKGESIVRTTKSLPRHNDVPVAMDHVRVTVLTFGGSHVIDSSLAELDERSEAMPAVMAATDLMDALRAKAAAKMEAHGQR
ncbi:MAG TPA: hypothetical protein VJ276_20560 [Thermoanaerobaculia bacterium]|nr:hypothetical protein [Thermoanaerobaculia bacterium]